MFFCIKHSDTNALPNIVYFKRVTSFVNNKKKTMLISIPKTCN